MCSPLNYSGALFVLEFGSKIEEFRRLLACASNRRNYIVTVLKVLEYRLKCVTLAQLRSSHPKVVSFSVFEQCLGKVAFVSY